MSRHQFKLLVILNQLLLLTALVVREFTNASILAGDKSVFDSAGLNLPPVSDFPFWIGMALIGTGLVAAVGLCLEKRWGRTLYVGTFAVAVLITPLTELYVDTSWTVLVSYLAATSEGMIIALMFFSPIKRLFEKQNEA